MSGARERLTDVISSVIPDLGDQWAAGLADHLLPVVQALVAEGKAEALDEAAKEDSVSTHRLTPVEVLTLRVVKVSDLWTRAAALRATTSGEGTT